MEKHSVSRLSYLFAHLHLLSSDSFSSDLLSSNLSLLSASSLLCFSSVHIVGSLTSKLPSNIINYRYNPQSTLDLGLTCTNLAFTNWGTTGSIFPLIHPRAAQRWPRSQAKTRRRRPLRRYRPPGSDSSGSDFLRNRRPQ